LKYRYTIKTSEPLPTQSTLATPPKTAYNEEDSGTQGDDDQHGHMEVAEKVKEDAEQRSESARGATRQHGNTKKK